MRPAAHVRVHHALAQLGRLPSLRSRRHDLRYIHQNDLWASILLTLATTALATSALATTTTALDAVPLATSTFSATAAA